MLLQAYTPYSWLVELNAETQTIFLQISEGSNLIVNQTIKVTNFLTCRKDFGQTHFSFRAFRDVFSFFNLYVLVGRRGVAGRSTWSLHALPRKSHLVKNDDSVLVIIN